MASENPSKAGPESRLDVGAPGCLEELTDRFVTLLLADAAVRTQGNLIRVGDLEESYRQLVAPEREALKDTQEIISRGLRENQVGEWIAYGMTAVLFTAGTFLLVLGALREKWAGVFAGTVAEVLFAFPLHMAISIRRNNLGIRMLGKLMDRVRDPAVLAKLLKENFAEIVIGMRGSPGPRRGGRAS